MLGVSELSWILTKQDLQQMIEIIMTVYSGRGGDKRRTGVGFIVEKTTAKCVFGYNERVITLRMKGHPMNTTFVQLSKFMHSLETHQKRQKKSFMRRFRELLTTNQTKMFLSWLVIGTLLDRPIQIKAKNILTPLIQS